jgi:hypothetical protein
VSEASSTLGDVIRRFGPALREQRGAALTPAQDAVLAALGRCRTAALGGHLYRCDHCGSEHPAYNSCRSRHCPSCLGHKSAQWLDARAKEVLPAPYFHVVFTVPEPIAALALGNKKLLYGILFRAAAQTLLEIAADPKHLGATIGFLAILHTWTQTLLHHPHLHCVVPGGGLSPDGTRWVPCRESFFLSVKVLSALFRGKFLAFLEEAARRKEVRFAGSTVALAEPAAWATFIQKMRSEAWVVYAKPPFGSPEQVLKYLARYTHRVAISNSRIVSLTDEYVSFRYRDRKRGDVSRTMTLGGVEFLRRFLLHVLPKGFVRIRHFGLFANRLRKSTLERCRELLGGPMPAVAAPPKIEGEARPDVRPEGHDDGEAHLCPLCGVGRLHHVAILLREHVALTSHSSRPVPAPDTS